MLRNFIGICTVLQVVFLIYATKEPDMLREEKERLVQHKICCASLLEKGGYCVIFPGLCQDAYCLGNCRILPVELLRPER